MKICIFGDNHWSTNSSILRKKLPNHNFSLRLENEIQSMNWVENLALENLCDKIVCLGDFFDSQSLNGQEITALKNVQWVNIPHIFLVGNHEMSINDLSQSSSHLFNLIPNCNVIDHYTSEYIDGYSIQLCYLPYILESNRQETISYYFPLEEQTITSKNHKPNKRIIFSHNDIKGIQMGQFISKSGFDIEDIEGCCDLFINGHLHNGSKISDKIINCGNLTGQNFSEDAIKYDHVALILDTNTMRVEVYENPYALNFLKLDINRLDDLTILNTLKPKTNFVLSIKCPYAMKDEINTILTNDSRILEYRINIEMDSTRKQIDESFESLTNIDHLHDFVDFVHDQLGNNDLINEELQVIIS